MPLNPAVVGRTYPPQPVYEVGREKIREFADAISDGNPAYRDRDAARALGHPDVVAPPTFAVVLSRNAQMQVVFDPDVGLDFTRVVHGEQRFAFSRPIVAGDRLVATAAIDGVRSAAGNDILSMRVDVADESGEHVVTATATLVSRGTAEG